MARKRGVIGVGLFAAGHSPSNGLRKGLPSPQLCSFYPLRLILFAGLLGMLPSLLSGCYAGVAGAVVGFLEILNNKSGRHSNTPPFVEILPIAQRDLETGILPIRYRIIDPDSNPVNLSFEVDLRDGQGLRRANEFPASPSEGTHLQGSDGRFHTFLWDALSQPVPSGTVRLRVRAADKKGGRPNERDVSGIDLTPYAVRKDIIVGDGSTQVVPRQILASGDFDGDGALDLVLANNDLNSVSYLRGGPDGLSQIRVREFKVGRNPRSVQAGDFNKDGFIDLAVLNLDSKTLNYVAGGEDFGLLEVEEIIGDKARTIPLSDVPMEGVAKDFDGNGYWDLAVAYYNVKTINVFLGGSLGLSLEKLDLVMSGNPEAPILGEAMATGDFNHDGAFDLLVATDSGSVHLFPGMNGARQNLDGGMPPLTLVTNDLNGDRIDDLTVADSRYFLTYFPGSDKQGLLPPRKPLSLGNAYLTMEGGDFDGDDVQDLVVARPSSLSFLRGTPDGPADVTKPSIQVGTGPLALLKGDFDLNGFVDLVVGNSTSNSVSYLYGGADGLSESRRRDIEVGSYPWVLADGDFDGDGDPDLVVYNRDSRALSYFRGNPGGPSPDRKDTIELNDASTAMLAGDFDGDETLDLVVAQKGPQCKRTVPAPQESDLACQRKDPQSNEGAGSLVFLYGGPDGLSLGTSSEIVVGVFPTALAAGDFSGDGALDLAVANLKSDTVTFLRGGQERGVPFSPVEAADVPVGQDPSVLATGRLDDDVYLDLVVANSGSSTVSFLRGGPNGLIRGCEDVRVGQSPTALLVGDFEGDQHLDVAVANRDSNSISYLKGSAQGPCVLTSTIQVGRSPSALVAGDFNSDGALDLLVANQSSNNVTYIPGSPTGLDAAHKATIPVGRTPGAFTAGDFDGDGTTDAVVANFGDVYFDPDQGEIVVDLGSLTFLRGSKGGLVRVWEEHAGNGPSFLKAEDFDGDGNLDLLAGNLGSPAQPDPVTLSYIPGGSEGLSRARKREMDLGNVPLALGTGDFNGDGVLDWAVATNPTATNPAASIQYFPSRYLVDHVNCPLVAATEPCSLTDPRTPPRYDLQLEAGALSAPSQLVIIPTTVFSLPHGDAKREGKYLTVVTEAVTLLPKTLKIEGTARLVLGLRSADPEVQSKIASAPQRLKVFRKGFESNAGTRLTSAGGRLVEAEWLENGNDTAVLPGIRFLVNAPGSYLVTFEEDR